MRDRVLGVITEVTDIPLRISLYTHKLTLDKDGEAIQINGKTAEKIE
jgi:hypothetical protein